MESQKDIILNFIEQNGSKINFSDGNSYSTYMPATNPIDNLSSFAKSRGIKDADKLKKDLFEILENKYASPKIKDIAQKIMMQITDRLQLQETQLLQKQKKEKANEITKENNEKERMKNEIKEKQHQEELKARREKKENKEKREEGDSMKQRLISMGQTERHINTIIDALLKEPEILEVFIDKSAAENIRKKANYGITEREIQDPKIKNIMKRFKKKMEKETVSIPNLETIRTKPSTNKNREIEIEYKNNDKIVILDEKTYDICKYNQEETKRLLTEETFEIRKRLLGRMVEYIQMDILKEKLHYCIKGKYKITKTDIVDDTMTGIDFILLFKDTENNEKQLFIDVTTALSDKTLSKKSENAKKESTPYNYFIERTLAGEHKKQTLPKAEKFIEESEQYTTPYIINRVLEHIEEGKGYMGYIKDFFATEKGKITNEAANFQRYLPAKEKYRTEDIINEAKKIDTKKIEEKSIAA